MKRNKIRVWFNHWFSTAYHIINLMKTDEELDFLVFGSNEREDSVIKLACDRWFVEPRFENDAQYVDYCLEFCADNGIDVFIPRRGMRAICRELEKFEKLCGVRVLTERDYSKLSMLNDKNLAYAALSERKFPNLPDTIAVNCVDEFELAYKKLKTDENRVCVKLAKDEGAVSFKVIDDNEGGHKISYTNLVKALSARCDNLLVMPYLTGCEVSVDCLRTLHGDIFVPRYKTDGRAEEIRYDNEILDLSAKFTNEFALTAPFNIQFKYHNGVPYFLEVNTRMSGGIQFSCLAAGVNIPNIAVNQLIGINKTWSLTKKNCKVSYIETPVILTS